MLHHQPDAPPAPRRSAEHVFTERFDALAAIAYRVAFRILGDRHICEEIAQEALARAYSRWRKVSSYAEPWVAKVAGNLAIDQVRKKPAATVATAPTEDTDVDATVTLRLDLQQALRSLPPRQRETLILRYLADMPESAVGKALGIRPGSVKQHLHRGTEAMRALLIDPAGG
jgi:RNA polymerase sigma factor (sigma-70 family)